MKQFRRWCLVVLVAFAVLTPVTFSLLHMNNVSANTELGTEDLNTIKQNALYKVIYSNLAKCYGSMQGTITESAQNTWASFDSSTYFTDDALADSYLQFPYGVGNQNQSSCPDMITGWNTNWFINLFTGTGSYDGILSLNADAEVPNSDWYDSSTAKMGNFLKDIGYEETTQDDGDLSDRSCFHLRFKLNQDTYRNWWVREPSSGEYFETVDYCVKLNGDNTLQQYNDSIIALKGNNDYFGSDYDNGHLTDDSNIAFIFFKRTDNALTPQFRHVDDANISFSNENYLQANVDYVALRYNAYNPSVGTDGPQANTLVAQSVTSKTTAEDHSLCSALGYVHCGWYDGGIFSPTIYIGSLMDFGGSITYSQFKSRMVTLVDTMKDDEGYDLFSSVSAVDYNPVDRSYKKGSSNAKFIRYFLGDTSNYNSGTFTDAEKYMLYYTYLKNNYNVATSDTAVGENSVQVSWLNEEDGTFSRVYIYDPDENLSTTQLVLSSDGKWDGTSRANWHEIAEMLAAIDVETAFSDAELTDSVLDPDLAPGEESGGTEVVEDPCYEQAGALGWIMCPVVTFLNETMEDIYGWVEANFLQVRADIFSDAQHGVEETWGIFRNIANTIFVIVLIVIILSQLTGVGVSNYGIKKMLPRIIVAAILINLSYIICELVIDLSNILGASLKNMLQGIVTLNSAARPTNPVSGGIVIGTLSILGVTLAIILNPAVLITILLFLLSGMIAVVFLWILLIARQAGVILGVILSPIAIALYMLPNTQGIFKRYIKIMQGLLLLYPICGLVVGGGAFAAIVMVNIGVTMSGDAATAFVLAGMALQVLPFFFVPVLLKGSFAALGNVGAKISGFGSRLGGRVNQGIRKTNTVQDMQRRGAERRMRIRAGLDKNGNVAQGKLAKLASIGPGRNRRRAAASAVLDKNYATSRYGDAGFMAAQAARRQAAQESSEVKAMEDLINTERMDNGGKLTDNTKALQSRYEDALRSNDSVKIKAYQNVLASKGEEGRQAIHNAVKNAEKPKIDPASGRVLQGAASREALQTHASNLVNNHAGDFKPNSRDTFNHAAGILDNKTSGIETYENDAKRLVGKLKDATLGSMDDAAFDRLSGAVAASDDQTKERFYDAAYDAIHNDSAMTGVDDTRKRKLIELASRSAKAKVVPVPSGDNASTDSGSLNPRTQTTGDVLRIGNDSPASRSPQPPIPDGATVTDSGLVIARGDMSGEQIRRYAEEMKRYNNRNNQNGQNNQNNGQGGQGLS